MSLASVYIIDFSDETALRDISEYDQKNKKTVYSDAEAVIFV